MTPEKRGASDVMTPRERALCSLRHQVPDEIPAYVRNVMDWERHAQYFGVRTEEELFEHLGNTIRSFEPSPVERAESEGQPQLSMWGLPADAGGTYSDSIPRPLAHAQTPAHVDEFAWPSGNDWDFGPMREGLKAEHRFARLSPSWNPVFSRLCELFGMEQTLLNLINNLPVIEVALAHLDAYYTDYYSTMLDVCGDYIDIFGIGDDFAGNQCLLMSPKLWRKLFKPLYAKWLGMAKSRGLPTFMHCCGQLVQVLPDLIDIGLDAWQTVQTHLIGQDPDFLKREYGQHLTFIGAVDTSNILGLATPDEVAQHVKTQILALGKQGGYICAPDHTIMSEVPSENVEALYATCAKFRERGYTSR